MRTYRHGLTKFVEITERRNLFVHTGGQVSSQYLQACKTHKIECGALCRGDVLLVDPEYFSNAYHVIAEVGVKLAHVFWRKLKPEDLVAADVHLNSIAYNLLAEEKYSLALSLLDFATEVLKKHGSAETRLIFMINRIQAYKWSGKQERADEILNKEDFSAVSDVYKLAEAVLRDDYARAVDFVRRIGQSEVISLGKYRDWPLFRELRKQPEFEAAILDIYGESINKVSVPSPGLPESPVM